jgi:hypothetical protein
MVFRKRVQGGKTKSSATSAVKKKPSTVQSVLKQNEESEEEENSNAHQLLNVEVDLPAKRPRVHSSMYESSSVASSVGSSVADSNSFSATSSAVESVGSVECLDGVLPSTARRLAIAYIFVEVFRAEDDETKWCGQHGIVSKMRVALGLNKDSRIVSILCHDVMRSQQRTLGTSNNFKDVPRQFL